MTDCGKHHWHVRSKFAVCLMEAAVSYISAWAGPLTSCGTNEFTEPNGHKRQENYFSFAHTASLGMSRSSYISNTNVVHRQNHIPRRAANIPTTPVPAPSSMMRFPLSSTRCSSKYRHKCNACARTNTHHYHCTKLKLKWYHVCS